MKMATNPYIAGVPLRNQEGFFGRRDILDWVSTELRNVHTTSLVLYGPRRIGKTSVLLQLRRYLPVGNFLPVYFDLQDQATRRLGKVLADLADAVGDKIDLPKHPLEYFDDEGNYFRSIFLPSLYRALNSGIRPVFLFDEFDVLDQDYEQLLDDRMASRALFPFLRQLMNEDARPAFVFVVGRRNTDLRLNFTQLFKTSLMKEVWLLDRKSAEDLIRQAEINKTLNFTEHAIDRILQLSSNHPYFTQLICQRLWERAYLNKPSGIPVIDVDDVNLSVEDTLSVAGMALSWLWSGLGVAEKVYAAALATISGEGEPISGDHVIKLLTESSTRLRVKDVETAPRDLVTHRILNMTEDRRYLFAIELIRRWVKQDHPLGNVIHEIDDINPLAQQLFSVGKSFLQRGERDKAIEFFQEALRQNPNHFSANLYLGESLLETGRISEAVDQLGLAYALDSYEAKYPFARALIAFAKEKEKVGLDHEALVIFEQALQISPNERWAIDSRREILKRLGNI